MPTCKVTMLRNPSASFGCSLREGETGEVDQEVAEQLAKRNIAVVVEVPKSIKAIPAEPAIKAEEQEADVASDSKKKK